MQIKWILSFICFIVLLCEVQAKAVERSKHASYTGPYDSSSIHITDFSKIVPSKIGKPLYFGSDSIQYPEPSINENHESPSPDKYELSNYDNLEGMFDTKQEFFEPPKFIKAQNKMDNGYAHPKVGTKIDNDRDVFGEDQVFIPKNKIKRIKTTNNEGGVIKSSKFQKLIKSTDSGPPCDIEESHDFNNKSTDEHVSSMNVHGMIYGNQYEQKSPSKIHEPISEDFHQYETKIMHKIVDLYQTESPIINEKDKGTVQDNFGRVSKKDDHTEKKSTKLEPLHKELNDLEISKEILNSNQLTETTSPIQLNTQNVKSEAIDNLSKSEEDKHLLNMEIKPESNFKSFVFNPNAQPQEVFQECTTPKNETGHCRYIQHCMLPSILSSIRHFMDNVCTIEDRFIGVCCPEFPVHSVLIDWPGAKDEFNGVDEAVEVPEDCGVGTNRRIVGGLNAGRKAWPWMVALLNNQKKFFCGGSLINNRYVLTAAHCTFGPNNNQITARLGEYDFNDPREPHDDYSIIEIKRHGQYARFALRNDIAVLKLDRPVVFNEFVKTICLPDPDKDYKGKLATLAGWGHINGGSNSRRSNVLQEASFPVIGNDECGVSHGVPIASSVICTADPEKDKGACNGDSGGPLMLLDNDERWKVIGAVSWGRRGCDPKFPTAFSRVTHYLDWIKEHTT